MKLTNKEKILVKEYAKILINKRLNETMSNYDLEHHLTTIYKNLLKEFLKYKNNYDGEFKVWDFSDASEKVGHVHLRLKKGWNQLHIEIHSKFQGKGYSVQMIEAVIDDVDYISIPEGRIINNLVYKIIDKFKNNSKYEVWKTNFDEWIISNKKKSREEINKFFK